MSRVVNLTPAVLRRIIAEEKQKIMEAKSKKSPKISGKPKDLAKVAKETQEVEAKDMAHTLANEVEHYKKLQNEAARLAKRLSEINEARQEIRAHILEQL